MRGHSWGKVKRLVRCDNSSYERTVQPLESLTPRYRQTYRARVNRGVFTEMDKAHPDFPEKPKFLQVVYQLEASEGSHVTICGNRAMSSTATS